MAEEFETEEQRVEALMKWWKDNRKSVITGLIAGIAIVVGWNSWKAYQREQNPNRKYSQGRYFANSWLRNGAKGFMEHQLE